MSHWHAFFNSCLSNNCCLGNVFFEFAPSVPETIILQRWQYPRRCLCPITSSRCWQHLSSISPIGATTWPWRVICWREFTRKTVYAAWMEKWIAFDLMRWRRAACVEDGMDKIRIRMLPYTNIRWHIGYNKQKSKRKINEGMKDNYPKYVVSMNEFDMSRNGIIHLNIRDFLLNFQNK